MMGLRLRGFDGELVDGAPTLWGLDWTARLCFESSRPHAADFALGYLRLVHRDRMFWLRAILLSQMTTAYIGMGSNLPSPAGPPEATLAAATARLTLGAPRGVGRITARSSLYSTEPVGFAAQPRFVNAVVALETALTPRALLDGLLAIEAEFGRNRAASVPNGPRTLDLDILLFGGAKISEPGLEIPHPRLADRTFVLIPLHEIAPNIEVVPGGATVSQILDKLRASRENDVDAVVPMQSEIWHGGADPRSPGAH